MSGTAAPRPPLAARLLPGPVRSVARNLWGTFRFAPWPLKVMFVVIAVGGPLAVGLRYGTRYVRSARVAGQVAEWRGFEEAVRVGDEGKMAAALDRVLVLAPDDPLARSRKAALDGGEADPADQPMVRLMVRRHLRAGRLADAARESKKRLAAEKSDWLARCVVAADLLQRGDKAGAAAELDRLPAPNNVAAGLDPGGLLFAAKLFKATDRDTAPLRSFTQGVILPLLRATAAGQLPAAEKAGLLECYVGAFEPAADRPQPAGLVEGWAAAARLADAGVDEGLEARDTGVLARLGRLGEPLEGALASLLRAGQVTDAEARVLAADLRDRTRRAWEGARAADPANADAYRGLAGVLLRSLPAVPAADRPGLYDQARKVLTDGLAARPDDPELAQQFGRLLAAEGRPLDACQYLLAQAHAHPDRPVWWILTAEAALAADRREVALDACAQVRQKDPDNRWAARTEARLRVQAGQPAEALAVLGRLGDDALRDDPVTAYTFARALAETRAAGRLAEFLRAVVAGERPPAAAAAAGRGLADAVNHPPADLLAQTEALLERHPGQPDLLRVRAEAAYRLAEAGPPAWDTGAVRRAVQAIDEALGKAPDDPPLVALLGWLRLTGENNPGLAAKAVAPLRRAADDPARTPRQLELLGAVALAENDLPAATRLLERAVSTPDPPAGAYALLARAYHVAGRPGPARTALDAARSRPRTDREQASYLQAAKLIVP